jgi:hypothetical protein
MNNTNSYSERQSVIDIGEKMFTEWATQKNWKVNRIGFDSKNDSVPNFFRLNEVLRNLPDFIVTTENRTLVVNVKGTANIKLKEINMLDKLEDAYSSSSAILIYAFCLRTKEEPILMSTETLRLRFSLAENQQWHDGVIYRTIAL